MVLAFLRRLLTPAPSPVETARVATYYACQLCYRTAPATYAHDNWHVEVYDWSGNGMPFGPVCDAHESQLHTSDDGTIFYNSGWLKPTPYTFDEYKRSYNEERADQLINRGRFPLDGSTHAGHLYLSITATDYTPKGNIAGTSTTLLCASCGASAGAIRRSTLGRLEDTLVGDADLLHIILEEETERNNDRYSSRWDEWLNK